MCPAWVEGAGDVKKFLNSLVGDLLSIKLGSLGDLSSKLLQLLEKSGISDGAELRSEGPSGPPDQELVRAFEEALAGGRDAHPHAVGPRPGEETGTGMSDALRTDAVGTPQQIPRQDVRSHEADFRHHPDSLQELESLTRIADGELRPEELFRIQYLVGMLKIQTESSMQITQKTAQGFESLLKQQG
jgi:hypothetical protein